LSTFWSVFVVVVTVAMLAGCYLLLALTRRSQPPGGEEFTKDHDFDGITELETPMPLWWYYMFVGSIAFAVIYLLLYPGLGNFAGLLGWTQEKEIAADQRRAEARYAPIFERYAEVAIPELAHDTQAMRMGQRLFGNHCAQCHGTAGTGSFGFPNLTDDEWLWGGSPEAIKTSIAQGRQGRMPPWEAALGDEGIAATAQYVLSLSSKPTRPELVEAGREHYQQLCVACHGTEGRGNAALGAPDLTDDTWLYGGSADEIAFTLRNGRQGAMPAHQALLKPERIHLLAAYVYGLSRDTEAAEPGYRSAETRTRR